MSLMPHELRFRLGLFDGPTYRPRVRYPENNYKFRQWSRLRQRVYLQARMRINMHVAIVKAAKAKEGTGE